MLLVPPTIVPVQLLRWLKAEGWGGGGGSTAATRGASATMPSLFSVTSIPAPLWFLLLFDSSFFLILLHLQFPPCASFTLLLWFLLTRTSYVPTSFFGLPIQPLLQCKEVLCARL